LKAGREREKSIHIDGIGRKCWGGNTGSAQKQGGNNKKGQVAAMVGGKNNKGCRGKKKGKEYCDSEKKYISKEGQPLNVGRKQKKKRT